MQKEYIEYLLAIYPAINAVLASLPVDTPQHSVNLAIAEIVVGEQKESPYIFTLHKYAPNWVEIREKSTSSLLWREPTFSSDFLFNLVQNLKWIEIS